jgi:hypothetical protein
MRDDCIDGPSMVLWSFPSYSFSYCSFNFNSTSVGLLLFLSTLAGVAVLCISSYLKATWVIAHPSRLPNAREKTLAAPMAQSPILRWPLLHQTTNSKSTARQRPHPHTPLTPFPQTAVSDMLHLYGNKSPISYLISNLTETRARQHLVCLVCLAIMLTLI